MGLIVQSFILSFGVAGRMILPGFAIVIAASIFWGLLDMISAGLTGYISGAVTTAFISLFGIRMALSLMGDHRQTGYGILMVYAVLYGVALMVAEAGALFLADLTAVVYADWKLGGALSLRDFANAEKALQFMFAVHAFSAKALVAFVLYTAVHAAFAVPLASVARAAGIGAPSVGYLDGFGRSFIPLFCVFAVAFFLQFFFGLFASLFAIIPLALSLVSIVIFQAVPSFDPEMVLYGVAAAFGLLWLNAWGWAASAIALNAMSADTNKKVAETTDTSPDLRALRKARDNG